MPTSAIWKSLEACLATRRLGMSEILSWKNTMLHSICLPTIKIIMTTSKSSLPKKAQPGPQMTLTMKKRKTKTLLQIKLVILLPTTKKILKMMSQELTPQTWAKVRTTWQTQRRTKVIQKKCTPSSLCPPWLSSFCSLSSSAAAVKRPKNSSRSI